MKISLTSNYCTKTFTDCSSYFTECGRLAVANNLQVAATFYLKWTSHTQKNIGNTWQCLLHWCLIKVDIKPPMENQSNSTTFTMTAKTAKVKNAMFALTYILHLILTMSHFIQKDLWDCSGYKFMIQWLFMRVWYHLKRVIYVAR